MVAIEGHDEVLWLHNMLMEYKFGDLDGRYAGSPIIAAIQRRLADALEAAHPDQRWREWRKADGHADGVEVVRRHLAGAGTWWQEADPEKRAAYVRDLLAPLRPSDQLVVELARIENAHR